MMLKKILIIICGIIALPFCVLFIATTLKKPLIPEQYCKQIYSAVKQCVPGCIWEFHEDVFTGYSIEDTPLQPKNETTCGGRLY